jgi:hypothetical protein
MPQRRTIGVGRREGCGIGAAWSEEAQTHGSKGRDPKQGQHLEAGVIRIA